MFRTVKSSTPARHLLRRYTSLGLVGVRGVPTTTTTSATARGRNSSVRDVKAGHNTASYRPVHSNFSPFTSAAMPDPRHLYQQQAPKRRRQQTKQVRFFSAAPGGGAGGGANPGAGGDFGTDSFSSSSSSSSPSVDETLDRLFAESEKQLTDAAASNSTSSASSWWSVGSEASQHAGTAATTAAVAWEPVWYNLSDQAIVAVNYFHHLTGLEYGWSIVGVTVILRLGLFPLMVKTQRTTSRMQHLQPELRQIQQRYEALGTPSRQEQLQFSNQMKALFKRYEVNPFGSFAAPLVQLPLFMGMFFGLRKMPQLFPDELSTGGMFWFVDLTATDPYYVLPLASSVSFLALIEMGKEQMLMQQSNNPGQGQLMLNIFRVMAFAMIPVCINFETSMLCYWTANNILTLTQTAVIKSPAVRKYFGIWDPPKPIPGSENKAESLTDTIGKLANRIQGKATSVEQQIERHNQAVEAKKKATETMRAARARRQGITGAKK